MQNTQQLQMSLHPLPLGQVGRLCAETQTHRLRNLWHMTLS